MQLVAYGAQDIYLTGNPQITFFKDVYRRHTNFSMEAIEQTFNSFYSAVDQVKGHFIMVFSNRDFQPIKDNKIWRYLLSVKLLKRAG